MRSNRLKTAKNQITHNMTTTREEIILTQKDIETLRRTIEGAKGNNKALSISKERIERAIAPRLRGVEYR